MPPFATGSTRIFSCDRALVVRFTNSPGYVDTARTTIGSRERRKKPRKRRLYHHNREFPSSAPRGRPASLGLKGQRRKAQGAALGKGPPPRRCSPIPLAARVPGTLAASGSGRDFLGTGDGPRAALWAILRCPVGASPATLWPGDDATVSESVNLPAMSDKPTNL